MEYKVNDRVRVRDNGQQWKSGTVIKAGIKPYVKIDQHETPGQWDETELVEDSYNEKFKKVVQQMLPLQCWTGQRVQSQSISCTNIWSETKKKRIQNLVFSGLDHEHIHFTFMGQWIPQKELINEKPLFKHDLRDDSYLWLSTEQKRWCIGEKNSIGSEKCTIATAKPTSKLPQDYAGMWQGYVEKKWKDLPELIVTMPLVFKVNERVKVSDGEGQWKYGTVIQGGSQPYVKLDGCQQGSQWKEVEHLSNARGEKWKRQMHEILPSTCWDSQTNKLSSLPDTESDSAQTLDIENLPIGTQVILQNLSKEKFNGAHGTIHGSYIQDTQRYPVKLSSKFKEKVILIQSKNLKLKHSEDVEDKNEPKFKKGDKVEVRQKQTWYRGTVEKAGSNPTVLVDGWQDAYDDWNEVRHFVEPQMEKLMRNMPWCANIKFSSPKEPETRKVVIRKGFIGMDYQGRKITKVFPEGEAEKAGICIGWKILEINDKKQSNDSNKISQALKETNSIGEDTVILFEIDYFKEGENVEVRDDEEDDWLEGVVTEGGAKPKVIVKGLAKAWTWEAVRRPKADPMRKAKTILKTYSSNCWNQPKEQEQD